MSGGGKPDRCVHCGTELAESIGGGLYSHINHRQRCQSTEVPYGHMGHPAMPCPPGDINPCSGAFEETCTHAAPLPSDDAATKALDPEPWESGVGWRWPSNPIGDNTFLPRLQYEQDESKYPHRTGGNQ